MFFTKGAVLLCVLTASFMEPLKQKLMLPQVAASVSHSASARVGPEGTNTCGIWAVSLKEPSSLFWWLTENRGAFPKADEVTGLRLCFCYGTMTSYLPGGVRLSSPCNCDLGVKTRPLSPRQIEAQRSDSLGYTSLASTCRARGLFMWSQCLPLLNSFAVGPEFLISWQVLAI